MEYNKPGNERQVFFMPVTRVLSLAKNRVILNVASYDYWAIIENERKTKSVYEFISQTNYDFPATERERWRQRQRQRQRTQYQYYEFEYARERESSLR